MKFGRIKRQHGRVGGLDAILNRIVQNCPFVSRIVPGRIKVRRGKTPPNFKIQYPTEAGLKCLYSGTGTVQEVFLICSDSEAAKQWLVAEEIASCAIFTTQSRFFAEGGFSHSPRRPCTGSARMQPTRT